MHSDYVNDGIELLVNNTEIGLNEFASSFLKDSLFGMISALNTEEYDISSIEKATIEIEKINPEHMNRAEIALTVNEKAIGINEFVSGIMKESIYGMVKALNTEKFGIDAIENIDIKIEK
ncbi:MAG: hypothetical protein Q4P18_03480 [Methanobrevibacter sp.]|uniref:hypothetical protein n=1 Tax=Methanobrevibacter sp. TaxID=66852 RepID=UPI0026E0AF77|nr:hypothetical protein [Methanobrevibacter sp.]MDO5848573.1 hypothetical protein [Methanobrevibacter sp.]